MSVFWKFIHRTIRYFMSSVVTSCTTIAFFNSTFCFSLHGNLPSHKEFKYYSWPFPGFSLPSSISSLFVCRQLSACAIPSTTSTPIFHQNKDIQGISMRIILFKVFQRLFHPPTRRIKSIDAIILTQGKHLQPMKLKLLYPVPANPNLLIPSPLHLHLYNLCSSYRRLGAVSKETGKSDTTGATFQSLQCILKIHRKTTSPNQSTFCWTCFDRRPCQCSREEACFSHRTCLIRLHCLVAPFVTMCPTWKLTLICKTCHTLLKFDSR